MKELAWNDALDPAKDSQANRQLYCTLPNAFCPSSLYRSNEPLMRVYLTVQAGPDLTIKTRCEDGTTQRARNGGLWLARVMPRRNCV